jgi:RNA polymerase sporulation-specific sigma factor
VTIEAVVGDFVFTRALFSWAAVHVSALQDPAVDRNDLEQEARVALWQACRTHAPRLSSVKTWCWRHVEFAVGNFLRVHSRKRRVLQASLDAPVDGREWRTLGDTVLSARDDAERLETVHLVRWLIQELDLTPLETLALRVHVLGGTYREIEQATGIPWKSLDNAWQRVRRKAQKLLEEELV